MNILFIQIRKVSHSLWDLPEGPQLLNWNLKLSCNSVWPQTLLHTPKTCSHLFWCLLCPRCMPATEAWVITAFTELFEGSPRIDEETEALGGAWPRAKWQSWDSNSDLHDPRAYSILDVLLLPHTAADMDVRLVLSPFIHRSWDCLGSVLTYSGVGETWMEKPALRQTSVHSNHSINKDDNNNNIIQ